MQQIHDRQPVILDHTYDAWLDPATPATEVKPLLARNLDGDLQFQRVSRTVNSVTQQKSPDLPGFCRRLWTSLDRLKRKFGAQKRIALSILLIVDF